MSFSFLSQHCLSPPSLLLVCLAALTRARLDLNGDSLLSFKEFLRPIAGDDMRVHVYACVICMCVYVYIHGHSYSHHAFHPSHSPLSIPLSQKRKKR